MLSTISLESSVRRILVEKRQGFDLEARALKKDLIESLHIDTIENLRILNRYDIEGIDGEVYENAAKTIFSEPNLDIVYHETLEFNEGERVFAIEYLPGQYDQRGDWAAQCIQIVNEGNRPEINTAKLYILTGNITDEQFDKIKDYIINPVDSREASLEKTESLKMETEMPTEVEILDGFIDLNEEGLKVFLKNNGLAMTLGDLAHVQGYFKNTEKRNPTITEIKVLDTYWSDPVSYTHLEDDYDLAGFSVGIADKAKIVSGQNVKSGDVLIGISSSGVHSNGYSFIRKIFLDTYNYNLDQYIEELGMTLGEALLTPTKIYVKLVLDLLKRYDIKSIAHITGGGVIENIPRVIPKGLGIDINKNSWEKPAIFKVIESFNAIDVYKRQL